VYDAARRGAGPHQPPKSGGVPARRQRQGRGACFPRRCGPGIARRGPVVSGSGQEAGRRLEARRALRAPMAASSLVRRRPHRPLSVHCLNPRYLRTIPGTQACGPDARQR
jgi:hypothetical protein